MHAGVLVNLGEDISIAGTPPAGGWRVQLDDDHGADLDEAAETVCLSGGGLATSSTTVRHWVAGGLPKHHIIDPRSGDSAPVVWRTVSVAARSCVDANTASTAAIIRGRRAPAWLEGLGLPSRLVSAEGTVLRLAEWPAEVGMTPVLAVAPSAWWYLTRAGGAVSLLLLTATVVLGVVDVSRWSSERWPRFVLDGLHRNVSLLALMTLSIHIVSAVLDSFAPVRITDVVVPFVSAYRPLWLGLGALAFEILLAVTLTSLARMRLGHKTWRAVHWAAYACWPLALLHGLGTGADTRSFWMLALSTACLTAVVIAAGWRTREGWPRHLGRRKLAATMLVLGTPALLVWVVAGPLASGWASRAGTPASLLASRSARRSPGLVIGPAPSAECPAERQHPTGPRAGGTGSRKSCDDNERRSREIWSTTSRPAAGGRRGCDE